MLSRAQQEAAEKSLLAPYAMRASASKGRIHRESEHPYRTCFQRDRDRIIHSTAFRRLKYKTQVFVAHEGDYYRTRLTHTLEVSQIAETAARALRLNTDLVRAVALAHDLGHGPFGHSGEDALRELMAGHGGFDHNLQALRIVDLLEERYPDFPGLNLTWEVREGLNKHRAKLPDQIPKTGSGAARAAGSKSGVPVNLSLEAQLVDWADEIAYDHHDLDDGIASGLIREEDLEAVPLWKRARREIHRMIPGADRKIKTRQVIRHLIDLQVTDLILESQRRLRVHRIRSPQQAQDRSDRMIGFSRSMSALRTPLKQFLHRELYHHHRVVRMADKARRFLTALFELYLRKPEQLPPATRLRLRSEDPRRVVCDYVAGMTDRYALQEYRELFYPIEQF